MKSDGWISVEKDLPDEEQVILVNNNDCVELSIYRGKKFICIHWFNHWRKVTHWLPIPPKPPVKEDNEHGSDDWMDILESYSKRIEFNIDEVRYILIPLFNWLKENYLVHPKPQRSQ